MAIFIRDAILFGDEMMSWGYSSNWAAHKDCSICGHSSRGPDTAIMMVNYNRHMTNHKDNAQRLGKTAIVIRGPPSVGKSATCGVLAQSAKELNRSVRLVLLDDFSPEGFVDDARERKYPNLQRLTENWLIVELGYGGFATKNPQTWAEKISEQEYPLHLFRLTARREATVRRTANRKDMTQHNAAAWWDRYDAEAQFSEVPTKLAMNEMTIDTSELAVRGAAFKVMQVLGL